MSYYDKNGSPIDRGEFERLSDDRVYVRVGATELKSAGPPEKHFVVSTVWTGADTGGREVFETLVAKNGENDSEVTKYHTWDEAVEGHNARVGQCMVELGNGPKMVREIPAEET
ncbi:hypothetical protein ACIOHC_36170 [Streptomyces sp. NPDC088252]|uniref:hypothetical protein n=1 Tax=Streptomyces sp. NPDC088252 TaxID=3365845 RepID=UPI0038213E56